MILLDTNLVSEPWKPKPDPRVVAWIDAQAVETLFLSAVTVAELRFGIAAMPPRKRRKVLDERLEGDLLPVFVGVFCRSIWMRRAPMLNSCQRQKSRDRRSIWPMATSQRLPRPEAYPWPRAMSRRFTLRESPSSTHGRRWCNSNGSNALYPHVFAR